MSSVYVQDFRLDENSNPQKAEINVEVDDDQPIENPKCPSSIDFPTRFLELELELNKAISTITFADQVSYVYNPIQYAFEPHSKFVHKYCRNKKKVLLLGMNPGVWGMCQTGVPFGDVKIVRDWMGIKGEVSKPERESPKKKINGFACRKSERSGSSLYGYFRDVSQTPKRFFKYSFVYNLCPLSFVSASGENITPERLKGLEKKRLKAICNETLLKIVELLKVRIIIAFGRYAEGCVKKILTEHESNIRLIYVVHPSPMCRMTRVEWRSHCEKALNDNNLMKYFKDK